MIAATVTLRWVLVIGVGLGMRLLEEPAPVPSAHLRR